MKILTLLIFFTFILSSLKIIEVHAESKHIIHMQDNGFNPQQVEIQKGETVVFENEDKEDHWPASNTHPTHQLYPEFDPKKPINPGKSWEFKFDKPGSWGFHDHLNPNNKGTMLVGSDKTLQESTRKGPSFLDKTKTWFISLLSSIKDNISQLKTKSLAKDVNKTLSEDQINDLYKNLKFNCQPADSNCIGNVLRKVINTSGPQAATTILEKLLRDGKVSRTYDEHQYSHVIGRQTAQVFGLNAKSFLLCPMSAFNGGCQHGFFEYALGKVNSAKEAAQSICESLGNDFSSKDKFYCYHGVGHGVMMAQAYDLKASLGVCDSLDTPAGQGGCWQGVFMENVNSILKGQAREGVFQKDDPLAPCNTQEKKYQHECFINHSGYLMMLTGGLITKAAQFCLNAEVENSSTCTQSLGLLTTNPSWQNSILRSHDGDNEVGKALELCNQFPENLQNDCFIGAMDNILNNDGLVLEKRALKFCQQSVWDKKACYKQIGINIARQAVRVDDKLRLCNLVGSSYEKDCRVSAGI